MAEGGDPDEASLPELTLTTLPIQEETDHADSPYTSHGNPCFVSGQLLHSHGVERVQSDCCEAVKTELKTEFHRFRSEMKGKIDSLIEDVKERELEMRRVELERDRACSQVEVLQRELILKERESKVESREHQQEIRQKNEEIEHLKQHNQELEVKIRKLTEEKEKLQECVENLTHRLGEVNSKVDNLENHNTSLCQEVEKLKVTLANQRENIQCTQQAEIAAAVKASENRLLERVVTMLSHLNTGGGTIPLALLAVQDSKLTDLKSSGSSRSSTPHSVSPSSSKPPTPPSSDPPTPPSADPPTPPSEENNQ